MVKIISFCFYFLLTTQVNSQEYVNKFVQENNSTITILKIDLNYGQSILTQINLIQYPSDQQTPGFNNISLAGLLRYQIRF